MTFSSWKCGETIEVTEVASRVGTRDTCLPCDADLHSCRNCRFYDASKHNQCAETQAEWVRGKEASNYCDYFSPNPVGPSGARPDSGARSNRSLSAADDAKKKFDSLFKV